MLRPDDRTILLDSLRPPAGYVLDAAVATTFTLTLPAAVLPPLAFSAFAMSSSAPDPVALLQAIRSAADKVDIFCQAGAVAIPAAPNDLFAFLEPMIHQVRRPRRGLFHPKVWAARFTAEDAAPCYRVLVLTRNLTHDRTWDLAVRLDSAEVGTRQPGNDGLADLLAALPDMALALPRRRADRVRRLARDLRSVAWQPVDGVSELTFHHLYDGGPVPSFMGGRHLVVSPFVDDEGLQLLRSTRRDTVLVSRAEELDTLRPETLPGLETYVLSSSLTDADADADAPSTLGSLLGLHAKLVVDEDPATWGRRGPVSMYVGSANATSAAWGGGNVELMLQLDGTRQDLGVDALLDPTTGFGALLESYATTGGAEPDPEDEELRRLENRLRAIAEISHTVRVAPDEQGTHTLTVTAAGPYRLESGWTCVVYPLTLAQRGGGSPIEGATFHHVGTTEITPFLCVSVTSDAGVSAGTVLLAELVGDPPDRLDLTLAEQLSTPERFLRFLLLVLSLGNPHLLAQLRRTGALTGDGATSLVDLGTGPGILELVLRALAERPESLDDLAAVVERLHDRRGPQGEPILPPGFAALWSAVEDARRALTAGGAR